MLNSECTTLLDFGAAAGVALVVRCSRLVEPLSRGGAKAVHVFVPQIATDGVVQ
jgi:hypothetical protein